MDELRKARNVKGLTQAQAAELCGISRFYYIDLELGRQEPSVKTAKKISQIFGFDWVLFYADEDSSSRE